jgi:hypothetical protein
MLSPDPYVQMPDFSQNFNRYSYCLNNPLRYTDPSGNEWWHWALGAADIMTGGAISGAVLLTGQAASVVASGLLDPVSAVTSGTITVGSFAANATLTAGMIFPMTSQGYEFQKYISPVAVMPTTIFSTEQQGFGFDISVGFTKTFPVSYRLHAGMTVMFNDYDNSYSGLQTRYGAEWTLGGVVNFSGTRFGSGETSQTTNMVTLGIPLGSVSYENDWLFGLTMHGVPRSDNGDRWRTAAVAINTGLLSLNLNIFTGDPGLDSYQRRKNIDYIDNHWTYTGRTADKYRAGVLSIGVGPFRIGRNSEKIREVFQNRFAHDILTGGDAKWFRVLPISSSGFWSFGTGTGGTLW